MTDVKPLRTNWKTVYYSQTENNTSAWFEGVSPEIQIYPQELEDVFTFRTLCFPILFSTGTLCCILFFFHSLILVRPTWPYSALLRARIMQQNREDFQEWYDKSVLHLDIEKVRHTEARSYTSIALAQRWPVMTNLLRTALNVAFTDIFFFFFYIDIQILI